MKKKLQKKFSIKFTKKETKCEKILKVENFDIYLNKINVIYGNNGAGKTTVSLSIANFFKKQIYEKNFQDRLIDLKFCDLDKKDVKLRFFTEEDIIKSTKRGKIGSYSLPNKVSKQKFMDDISFKQSSNEINSWIKNIKKEFTKKNEEIKNSELSFIEDIKSFKKDISDIKEEEIKIIYILKKRPKLSKSFFQLFSNKNLSEISSISLFSHSFKKCFEKITKILEIFKLIKISFGNNHSSKIFDKYENFSVEKVKTLSSGEQTIICLKKIIFGSFLDSFVLEKKIILLIDDPSIFLDLDNRNKLIIWILFFWKNFSQNSNITLIIFTHSDVFVEEIRDNFYFKEKLNWQSLERKEKKLMFLKEIPDEKIKYYEKQKVNAFQRLRQSPTEELKFSYLFDYISNVINFIVCTDIKDDKFDEFLKEKSKFKEWGIRLSNFKHLLETFWSHAFLEWWWEDKKFIKYLKDKINKNFIEKSLEKKHLQSDLFELFEKLLSEFLEFQKMVFCQNKFFEKWKNFNFINFQKKLEEEQIKITEKETFLQERYQQMIFCFGMRITLENLFFNWIYSKTKQKIVFFEKNTSYAERIIETIEKLDGQNKWTFEEKYEIYEDFLPFNSFINRHKHTFFYNSLNLERDFNEDYLKQIKKFKQVLEKYKK